MRGKRVGASRFVPLGFLLLFLVSLGEAQEVFLEQRVSPTDFAIMSWGPTPADSRQIQWMKEAGINIAGFARVKDLPIFEKVGMQVFVDDPRVNGYDFDKPLDEAQVQRNLESLASEVGKSPAVIGFMLRDEPHARSMPWPQR